MKTDKKSFWIGVKGGLLDQKHVEAMGPAVWMFLYLVRGQTGLNRAGEGIYQYGHPITLGKISEELKGTPPRTIRNWIARLKATRYIRTEDHGHAGSIFWIAKGKDKRKRNTKETHSDPAQGPKTDDEEVSQGPENDVQATRPRPNSDAEPNRNFQQPAQLNEDPAIPKASIPVSLSYFNNGKKAGTAKNHQSDDAGFRSPLGQAKQSLLASRPTEEVSYIEAGLDVIEHRARELGRKPASAKYYITAYENLKASEQDWGLVEWYVNNPSAGDRRKKVNALILAAEQESKRTDRPVVDCFHDLRQNSRWHEESAGAAS